jgi:transposase-like protein
MPRGRLDPEQKALAMKLIQEQVLSVAEIARESGMTPKNVARWKADMFRASGEGTPTRRRRRRRTEMVEPAEEDPDWELSFNLKALENEILRQGLEVNPTDEVSCREFIRDQGLPEGIEIQAVVLVVIRRLILEVVHARKRAPYFGDKHLTPIFYPKLGADTEEQPAAET